MRAALSCLDEKGREIAAGACGGLVLIQPNIARCLAWGADNTPPSGGEIRLAACDGATTQRWHLAAAGDAFTLSAVSGGRCLEMMETRPENGRSVVASPCSSRASQQFTLTSGALETQIRAMSSATCLAVDVANPAGVAVRQATCGSDPAQTWRLQRSIYR